MLILPITAMHTRQQRFPQFEQMPLHQVIPFKTLLVFPVGWAGDTFANDTTLVIIGVVFVLAEGNAIEAAGALAIFTD